MYSTSGKILLPRQLRLRQNRFYSTFLRTSDHQRHQQGFAPVGTTIVAALAVTVATATVHSSNDESSLYGWRNRLSKTYMEGAPSRDAKEHEDQFTTLLNWSGTHAVYVSNDKYFEPETIEQVEEIVANCHRRGQVMRPLGSALSPNAIGFQSAGMIGMAGLDQILYVDSEAQTVTVQAGARVSQVVEALRPYGLTLPNLASIAEQQMGGFIQVGAHGTGRCIAPVDHYVTKIKLVTPGKGTVTLTEKDGESFHLAKVGLGCLGVVVEITMKCIPAHNLVEHTWVLTRKEAVEQLDNLLKKHKHMRYMWIPYTDTVIVVSNDPEDTFESMPSLEPKFSEEERFQPLRELLIELSKDSSEPVTMESLERVGFGELRDALLAFDPLNIEHVKRCNLAEAEFWRRSEGYQIKPSDQLLQFDCGGQQLVLEMCFPTGKLEENNGNDMKFISDLLRKIEKEGIPAHSPIEQRWTASSSSLMSPAHGPSDGLFCWVGIINYLPSENERQRREITNQFTGKYSDIMRSVGLPYHATCHWAKLERPSSLWKLVDLKILLEDIYPLAKFNAMRAIYDPKNLMANDLLNQVIGIPQRPHR